MALDALDALLAFISVLHICMAPYTKVEESFNTQAMHDFLYNQQHLERYDHLEFPGVVPRTFIGALLVALFSSPFVTLIKFLQLPKLWSLYAVRLVLASFSLGSLRLMRSAIEREFGITVSRAFFIVTAVQFHLLFYSSRPLPNTFALVCVVVAYYFWIRGFPRETLAALVFTMIVFRCDTLLLLVPIGLSLLLTKAISILDAVKWCLVTALISTALTFSVDSIMWRRWLWPEFEVFWFNSVLNRSSEWGTQPFHWYFTSALPRALLVALPLSILGLLIERRVRKFVLPVLCFIVLYSKLPHKELRFIFFALPMLNLAAASAVARIYTNRNKGYWSMVSLGVYALFLASCGYTAISSAASYANYPGGHAIAALHSRGEEVTSGFKTVHIDVFPAMTGVSRFCENEREWKYSKVEGLTADQLASSNFTYLLNVQKNIPGFKCLMKINGFSRISLHSLVTEPKVYILGSEDHYWSDTWPGC